MEKINFVEGSKEEFYYFVNAITNEDKVAILSHNDLDGLASAIFLEFILKAKSVGIDYLEFISIEDGMFSKRIPLLKEKGITKAFVLDISADQYKEFDVFRKEFDTFLLDHHVQGNSLKFRKNVIKAFDDGCAAFILYKLGEGLIDYEKWNWLVLATIVADYAFKKDGSMKFLKEFYPGLTEENMWTSAPGKTAINISQALVYYKTRKESLKIVYECILDKNFEKIDFAAKEVEKEVKIQTKKFKEEAEYYPNKKLYFYYFNTKFNLVSEVITALSGQNQDSVYVGIFDLDEEKIKLSSRCQSGRVDLNSLMKKCVEEFEGATAGGHVKATGGTFLKKDFENFKERLLEYLPDIE